MCNVIIYYRSRPSEPEASETAIRLQREFVRAEVEAGRIQVVAEFVEEESEATDHDMRRWREERRQEPGTRASDAVREARLATRPAYAAAVAATQTYPDAELRVVSEAAIGSGEIFDEWTLGWDGFRSETWLGISLIATPSNILVPTGAHGALCLYADFRPGQFDTLIYLCNAGAEPLSAVTVDLDSISMFEFYTGEPEHRWAEPFTASEQRWDVLPARHAVLIDSLGHVMWDSVNRYRLTYRDAAGRRWTAEADSLAMNAERLQEDPTRVWEPLRPAPLPD